MEETKFILLVAIWSVFAVGYGGGMVYGMRFLRMNDLIDTRVPEFIDDTLFGKAGTNYKLFYYFHSQKHGKPLTITLLIWHFLSMIMIFAIPVIFG